jgi:hypothetical protein
MAIAGFEPDADAAALVTKAYSAAIRQTTSSAVKIARRSGASSVMGEKFAACASALSKPREKWCG